MATEIAESKAQKIAAALDAEDMYAKIYLYEWNAIVSVRRLFEGKTPRGMHSRYDWREIGKVSVGGRGLISVEITHKASEERVTSALRALKLI